MASLSQIVRHLDKYLRVGEIEDWPNALNGLQIENSGRITKIGAAVDVSTRVLSEAVKKDVDLSLDVHPVVGNNAQLAAALGLRSTTRFLEEKGQLIGLKARTFISRDELVRKLEKSLDGKVKAFAFGPKKIKTIGIITGGAGSEIYRVAEEKIDTFVTGEAPHWIAVAAEELGINLLLGGHYATETFGVKALAAHLAMRFKVSCAFIHCPTGL